MATYLQGVTDYIPDYQPFQPDLNFYANVLQAKQTQYDSNWKSLNNLYAELHNADLTHDQNIKKKDDLLKQIDFNIKRVTSLDLSLQQNIDQATQVFRPFYEDQYLMKDMAWTKNYTSKVSQALNLKNAQDEKMRAQYWDTGIKEMQYRREEFKNSTLEETLNMNNVTYTPYVNAMEKYLKLAKDTGLSIDIKDVDESGLYFVREKNGKALMTPLQNLFMSAYANDPALQAVYATQSYVKRKDYAEQYASKFNGNKVEAEKEYLKEQFNFLKNYTATKNAEAKETVQVTKNKSAAAQQAIENGEEGVFTESYLESLNNALTVDETVAGHAEKLNNEINGENSSTISTSARSGDPNELDLNNLELARLRVDSGTASVLAEQDILGASEIYAYRDYSYEKSANPVGLENLRHQNSLSRIDYTHTLKEKEMELKFKYDLEKDRIKQGLEDGTIWYDKEGKMHEDDGSAFSFSHPSASGLATGVVNVMADNQKMYNETVANLTGTYIGNTLTRLKNLADGMDGQNPLVTDKELWSALSFLDPNSKEAKTRYNTKSGRVLLNKMWNEYQNDPDKFILKFSKTNQVLKLKKFMDGWAYRNAGDPVADEYNGDESNAQIEEYNRYRLNVNLVNEHNNQKIKKGLIASLDSNEQFKKLKPETKERLADLYIKKVKTGGELDEDELQNFIDRNIQYEIPIKKSKSGSIYDERLGYVLGNEKMKSFNNYMNDQKSKWSDKNWRQSSEGKKIQTAANFQEYLDKKAIAFLSKNISDTEFKKLIAGEVYKNNQRIKKEGYDKKWLKKSPYDYTPEELASAKKQYFTNLNKLNIGHTDLYDGEGYKKGKRSFSEQTGADMEDLYDLMSNAYLNTITKTGNEGLQSFRGLVTTQGGKYGFTAKDLTGKYVRLNNPSYGGFQDFQEMMQDINRIQFNQDPSKYAVTYGGLTETAATNAKMDPYRVKALLRELQMSAGKGSKTPPFLIARAPMARENINLSAVVIYPHKEILEKYFKDAEGKTQTWLVNAVLKNGISFIAPKQQWTNSFSRENELSTTEAVLNAKGKIQYNSGNGGGGYVIERVRNVPGVDYRSSYTLNMINEATGVVEQRSESLPLQRSGNLIDDNEKLINYYIREADRHNQAMIQKFRRENNQEALANIRNGFRNVPRGGYKY